MKETSCEQIIGSKLGAWELYHDVSNENWLWPDWIDRESFNKRNKAGHTINYGSRDLTELVGPVGSIWKRNAASLGNIIIKLLVNKVLSNRILIYEIDSLNGGLNLKRVGKVAIFLNKVAGELVSLMACFNQRVFLIGNSEHLV